MRKLLKDTCGKDETAIDAHMDKTGFRDAMYLSRTFGNLYNGSLYAYLAALLQQEHTKLGNGIIGKTVMIASYGSGNTMMVFSGKIAEAAPEVIGAWDIDKWQQNSRQASFNEYLNWLARPKDIDAWRNLLEGAKPAKNCFYLKDFGETGLRIYSRG